MQPKWRAIVSQIAPGHIFAIAGNRRHGCGGRSDNFQRGLPTRPRPPPPLSISQRFVLAFCRSRGLSRGSNGIQSLFLCLPVKRSSRHPATRPDVSVLQKPQVIDLPCLGEDTTPAERWIDAEPPIPEPSLVRKKWQSDTALNPSAGPETPLTTSSKVFSFTSKTVMKTNKKKPCNISLFTRPLFVFSFLLESVVVQ